jgi:hypothetical protein
MRGSRIMLAISCLALALPHASVAATRNLRAERQALLDALLGQFEMDVITRDRRLCAGGQQPEVIARKRSLGATSLPDAADYCVTVLIRLARDGRLSAVKDTHSSTPTPAISLDTGFVTGYRQGGALAAALPTMATLRPIAERCLRQAEPDADLCFSTGFAFGLRAFHGEVVRIP